MSELSLQPCPRCALRCCRCPSLDEVAYLPGDEVPSHLLGEYLRRLDELRLDEAVRDHRRGRDAPWTPDLERRSRR